MLPQKLKKAYSLIELSIVIVIISILITGALSVSVSSVNNAKIKTTNERMKEIYKAIGNYLAENKRMPCPASLTEVKSSSITYGKELRDGNGACAGAGVYSIAGDSLVYGMVPVRSLGLANDMAEDGFESKFAYVVSTNFITALQDIPDFSGSYTFGTAPVNAVNNPDSGGVNIISVKEKPGSATQVLTTDAIMALVSFGSNKLGAFNANSSTQNIAPTDPDEKDNAVITSNSATANDNIFISSSSNSDVFDDIVMFKRRDDFVVDFNLMSFIACNGVPIGYPSAYYDQVIYATVECPFPNQSIRQARKCDVYGKWVAVIKCPA